MFHDGARLSNYVLNDIFKCFNWFKDNGIKIYCISGNHDMSEKNAYKHISPSYINMLDTIYPNIINLDFKTQINGDYILCGIPYINGNVGFSDLVTDILDKNKKTNKSTILITHSDLPGARNPNGFDISTVENIPTNISKFFRGFDLVLSGHIHNPQKLTKNVIMVGAPYQQKASDSGWDMGIWKLYDDLSLKFIKNKKSPKFIYIDENEEPINEHDFFIKIPQPKKFNKENKEVVFKANDTRTKLAKKYLKVKGIKSKPKRNILIKYLNEA
jgi:DNA repair exonuclease SbcCD nuclease subunit